MRGWAVIGILILLIGWSSIDLSRSQSLTKDMLKKDDGSIVTDQAPTFSLLSLENEQISLAQYKGKPVMINFWATWCPPCRAEMPAMEQFYQKNDITILAVNAISSEASVNDVESFVHKLNLSFPVLLDIESEVASLYKVRPLPTSIFIDQEGIIRHVQVGPMNEQMMVKVLSEM